MLKILILAIAIVNLASGQSTKEFTVIPYARVNWFTAQQICSAQDLTLASIASDDEYTQLKTQLFQSNLSYGSYWLSGTSLSLNNRWYWFNKGKQITNAYWAIGQPDNAGGREHCLQMRSDGLWNDVNCYSQLNVICEKRCES